MMAVQAVEAEGFAKPFDGDGQVYPAFGGRVPALRSFYLGYNPGGTGEDHEISLLLVLPGGQSTDLSPHADLSPSNIPEGRLDVTMQDRDPAGEQFFYKVSHSLLDIPGARRFQIRDVGCVGECVRKLPIPLRGTSASSIFPPLIALVGFKLGFIGGRDKELGQVGVWFRGTTLHVVLRDRTAASLDDTFLYLVDFVVIPTHDVNVTRGIQSGNAPGGEKFPLATPPDAAFMLTGWSFTFPGTEHETRDLGVLRGADDVAIFYGDQSADDRFDWRVEWAHTGRRVVAPHG
jgi:hypothetical protein